MTRDELLSRIDELLEEHIEGYVHPLPHVVKEMMRVWGLELNGQPWGVAVNDLLGAVSKKSAEVGRQRGLEEARRIVIEMGNPAAARITELMEKK